jgi:hypothetical protein
MIVTMIIVAGLATVIQVALQAMVVGLDMAQAMAMVADPAMAMVAGPVMAPQAMAMVVRPVMAVLPHTAHRQPEPIKKK